MTVTEWTHRKAMAVFDFIDGPAGRVPLTVVLVVIGVGLVLAERRADRKARGE